MKYTESQLESFTKPISDTEEQRCKNMINMVKDAIRSYYEQTYDYKMKPENYEIFLQGSYANNTNVKQNSDVDICVMYKNVFRYRVPEGCSLDGKYANSTLQYMELRNSIKQALIKKFGISRVVDKNKAIRISSNTYTTNADVVVAFQYRYYINQNNYKEGIAYTALDGTNVVNYPKIHIENGNKRNTETNYMYKKMVRVFKKIMYEMQEDNITISKEAKGFVLECMCYDYPSDKLYSHIDTKYTDNLKNMIDYYLNNSMSYWKEVNEIKLLFGIDKGKSEKYYKDFISEMKRYING